MTRELSSALFACLFVVGCTGSEGPEGAAGANGASVVASTTDEPAGANCPSGGKRFQWGTDDNGDGTLGADEVDGSTYICNGEGGSQSLVSTTPESPGESCVNGGIRVDHGIDDNNNGTLDAAEVDGTSYVCTGTRSLVVTAQEDPGQNCPNGGLSVRHGVDDNGNGTLEGGEVDGTSYVCDGDDGLRSLVRTSAEPVGMNCAIGGTRVESGIDDNGNDMLDAGEVDSTAFVCEAGRLFSSNPGAVVSGANSRTAGNACGTRLTVGAADVVVRKMAGLTRMTTAGNVKFVIMNHNAADAIVYASPTKAMPADGLDPTWKYSNDVGVVLPAGGSYCLVMTSDQTADYPYDQTVDTAGGLTSNVQNINVTNFASPVATSHVAADCGIQVITY